MMEKRSYLELSASLAAISSGDLSGDASMNRSSMSAADRSELFDKLATPISRGGDGPRPSTVRLFPSVEPCRLYAVLKTSAGPRYHQADGPSRSGPPKLAWHWNDAPKAPPITWGQLAKDVS